MTDDAAYQAEIRALTDEMCVRVNDLVDYLVTQPPLRLAREAARDFGWWCIAEGAKHQGSVQQRVNRRFFYTSSPSE